MIEKEEETGRDRDRQIQAGKQADRQTENILVTDSNPSSPKLVFVFKRRQLNTMMMIKMMVFNDGVVYSVSDDPMFNPHPARFRICYRES